MYVQLLSFRFLMSKLPMLRIYYYPNMINILLYEISANFGLWFKQHLLCFVETTLGRSDSLWLSPPPKNIVFRKQMFYICTCQFQMPNAMRISCKQCWMDIVTFPLNSVFQLDYCFIKIILLKFYTDLLE